jgi:hypothetical protein
MYKMKYILYKYFPYDLGLWHSVKGEGRGVIIRIRFLSSLAHFILVAQLK